MLAGCNMCEDMPSAIEHHPLFDEYWASKVNDATKVDLPIYLTASYS